MVAHLELVTIVQFVEDHTLSHLRQLFLGENHVDDGAYHELHLVVAIHMEPTLVALALRHHAYQPYHAEDVVGVGVGYEEMMDVGDVDASPLQLCDARRCRLRRQRASRVVSVCSAKHVL